MPGTLPQSEFRKQNQSHAGNTRDLLKSGVLDKLGANRFNPAKSVSFDALEEVLLEYAGLFLKGFADELDKADANASGFSTDSMRFEYKKFGTTYQVSVFMADYMKFVDEGVQGIDSGKNVAPNSPYRFKFANPSKGHIEKLEKWIREKNVRAIITVPKGIASEAAKAKSLAYAMGYSIKQKGLRATYFKKKTVERLTEKFKADVARAVGFDIQINIVSH